MRDYESRISRILGFSSFMAQQFGIPIVVFGDPQPAL
jgi:hypothetical protein